MAVPKLSPMLMLPCRRRLTRTQIRAGNKRRTPSHVTTHDPRSLMDLPRELRDEIFQLAVQDDIDPTREADLLSRPGPTIRALTQVSRSIRVEAADIYWSRTNFHYSAHDLVQNSTHEDDRGRYKLTSWLSTWGRLAVPHIRRLKLTLSFDSGGLDIQLRNHARPSINAWAHEGSGAEEYLKIIVTAELFPGRHRTMTPERLGKVCKILCELGRMIPVPPPRERLPPYRRLFIGGIPWHTNDESLRMIPAHRPRRC
jgi:hypothetical protein